MLEWIKNNYKSILTWLYRNIVVVGIVAICLFFLIPTSDIVRTILFCVLFEGIALFLSGVAVHLFTNIRFVDKVTNIKEVIKGEDNKLSAYELQAYMKIISTIFLAVHLLVGFSILSIYFIQAIN
ncbi:MAG TPA: hypothetical protein PKY56_12940 [Candidatus Kapabacteria bacterium]|nr:hypothetical protein [Candidatus Kapabacteria bacterium]